MARVHSQNMSFDISRLLDQWEYQPGRISVRRFKAKDGTEKIQLRVDLGILQMNAAGRPDGKRPFGHESLLQHYEARLKDYQARHFGSDEGFVLKSEDCSKLQQEAIQYYHRYICLFELGDFQAVIRDTARNMEVFDFVSQYAESTEMAWLLQQFKPQLIMMRTRAQGAAALQADDFVQAIKLVELGVEEIREFLRQQSRQDLIDQSAEIQALESWIQEIREKRPLSEREKLENALNEAVGREDYEKAAQVRDALRNLKDPK
jgi:hypothetical protein